MFESAKIEQHVDKEAFAREAPEMREALLNAQFDLVQSKAFQVVIIVAGVDGSGKGPVVKRLNSVLDARHINTYAVHEPSDEERERPRMWRFWRALPPRGQIGIFFGSWYNEPMRERILGEISDAELDQRIDEINRFEKMLADEGALILKFWLSLSREQQQRRLAKIKKGSKAALHVIDSEWAGIENYEKASRVGSRIGARTSTGHAPWFVINGANKYYRNMTLARTMLAGLRRRLDEPEVRPGGLHEEDLALPPSRNVLSVLDLSRSVACDEYRKELKRRQRELLKLSLHQKFQKRSVVVIFEGNDAAGKGGAIRRVVQALDPRRYRVIPIAAPTDEEKAQPYLWRFWRYLPRWGNFAIFDRSWYGRVLVERVERFCSEEAWRRAYHEIREFEHELTQGGITVVKFWLAIDKDEQRHRFEARQQIGFKRYKITDEDWRNREKWDEYSAAVCEMIDRTSTENAPWTLVEANDKYYARLKVIETLCTRMKEDLR